MRSHFVLAVAFVSIAALGLGCGGVADVAGDGGGTGGDAQATGGSGPGTGGGPGPGGTGGTGGTGGDPNTGGTGGDGGTGGTGHVGTIFDCTPGELQAVEEALSMKPAGGFTSFFPSSQPISAVVEAISRSTVQFRTDDGQEGSFGWPAALPFEIPLGAEARLARVGAWDLLVTEHGSLAVLAYDGFSPPQARFPGEHLDLFFATSCQFDPGDLDVCGGRAPPGQLWAVAGRVVGMGMPQGTIVHPGRTAWVGGWTFENRGAFYQPSFENEGCIIEGWGKAWVLGHTTGAAWAPF